MFDALREYLASGQQQGGINYGQVLKTLGLQGMNTKDKADMTDVNDITTILGMFGAPGGAGAGAAMQGGALSGLGGNTLMGGASFGNTMMP